MKHLFAAIMMLSLLSACASYNVRTGQCRHDALYAAAVMGESYSVEIVSGPTLKNQNIWHAQARAKIDGQWRWLHTADNKVWVSEMDQFEPLNPYTINQFIGSPFLPLRRD